MNNIVQKIISYSTTAMLFVMLTVASIYAWEYSSPADKYIDYYGHISQYEEYYSPQQVTMFTFGTTLKTIPQIDVYNQMLCTPINSQIRSLDFIGGRKATYYNWQFQNSVPDLVKDTVQGGENLSRIGSVQQDAIRRSDGLTNTLVPWTLGDLVPSVTSECYVTSELMVYSTIFKIPKTIHFRGNNFIYIVDNDD